jgi:urease accessory protein
VRLTTDGGRDLLLDLPAATVLKDGDGLVLESGGWVVVRAAEEKLAEITCVSSEQLIRVAWHIGNRHLATQVFENRLLVRNDHVVADMARRLGARVRIVDAPFDPEGGAYGNYRSHGTHGSHHG